MMQETTLTTSTNYPNIIMGDTSYYTYPYYVQVYDPPKVCTERVHVFHCNHCKKCQCGKLTLPEK